MAIGKSFPMLDAESRVTGKLSYMVNLKLPGMVTAKVLRSPLPHARITRLETRAAEALTGVKAVVTAADFDPPGSPGLFYGFRLEDQPVVALDRVRFAGEPVALVAAEDAETAEAALRVIEVEYEELPAVYDALEAMSADAPVLHDAFSNNCFLHAKLRRGDVEGALARADEVVEETFTSPVAQQASLEPHVSAAQWTDGRLTVWSATQTPYLIRRVLADLFGLPEESVRVIVPPLGGGYGGKGHIRIEPIVAVLAWKLRGRPAKLTLTRAEEFVTVTKHPARINIRTGVNRDGTLIARQVTLHWGAGAYADASPALVHAGMVRAVGPYRLSAVKVDSFGVYTNLPPAAAFRGAMSSQTTWAYESHMDTLAHLLDIDPLELRLKNLLRSGDRFATGEELHDVHFVECLMAASNGLGWDKEKRLGEKVAARRGRGLAVMMKSTIASSKSSCRMVLEAEGQLKLFTSTVEMGQGAHTALAQIAAAAVGLALDRVTVVGPDTEVTPFDTSTNASRSTSMMGNAIVQAAETLKAKLREAAAPLLEAHPEALISEGGYVFERDRPERLAYAEVLRRSQIESLEAVGESETEGGLDPETGQGIATPHWHQGAGACEVEVDIETGRVRVLRYHSAAYAGKVVNPALAELQNDGNVIFGIGPALMEEVVFDHGQILNPNLSDYAVPSFMDAPPELDSDLIESESGEFHGIGEMTLPPVAPAIANAVFDAVGVRIRDLPITPEKVLRALKGRKA